MSSPYPRTAAPPAVQGGAAGTLRRLNIFTSTRQSKRCRNCKDSSVIILDQHTGDELCSRCGLVLEGRVMSEEQEWRNFSNNDGGGGAERSRVGGPNDTWLDSGGVQGTAMLGGDPKHDRLMQAHEMATSLGNSDKLLRSSFGRLKSIIEFFNLRDNILERCKEIAKDLQAANALKSRTGDVFMLAVVYCACREEHVPRTIKEREVGRAINRLKKLLPSRTQPISPVSVDLMARICSTLQLSNSLSDVAEHVSRKAELLINKSHRPNSVAAGAVYLVTQICGITIEPTEIAAIAKTGVSTVLTVYKEMLPLSEKLLPPGFNPRDK